MPGAREHHTRSSTITLEIELCRGSLGLRLLLQGEGVLPAQLQLDIAKRWKAAQLQQPVFERISATKWEISCCWCDGLWKPSSLDHAEVTTWAIDTALQVLEYVLVLKGMLTEFQARKKP